MAGEEEQVETYSPPFSLSGGFSGFIARKEGRQVVVVVRLEVAGIRQGFEAEDFVRCRKGIRSFRVSGSATSSTSNSAMW